MRYSAAFIGALWVALGCAQTDLETEANTFTVSRETTYVTEPISEDGMPAYHAALNALRGEGVTPENNMVTLLAEPLGMELGQARHGRARRVERAARFRERDASRVA